MSDDKPVPKWMIPPWWNLKARCSIRRMQRHLRKTQP